jgi:hypothetical protein
MVAEAFAEISHGGSIDSKGDKMIGYLPLPDILQNIMKKFSH